MAEDTTAPEGSIDAVAASLIEGPQNDEETTDDDLVQAEADADSQNDADTTEEADEADEGDDTEEGDDEGDADAEEDEPAEQLFTVKVDGREQQVPLSELLRGYSGQAYIQQGMKQVAQARTEVEQVFHALQSERQQLAQFAQAAATGQLPLQPPVMPDEALLQTDPIGYLEARVKFDKDLAAYQQTQYQMQELQQRTAQAEEQARLAYLAEQHRQLQQIIPAFAKPETAKAMKEALIAAGTEVYGFTPEELRGVTDHRHLRVLHDAAQYRRLMAGKKPEVAKVAPKQTATTPYVKAGAKVPATAGKRAKAEQAKAQMRRTGSVDDVAKFLLM